MAYSRPSGQFAFSRPLPETGHARADLLIRAAQRRGSRSWRRRTLPPSGRSRCRADRRARCRPPAAAAAAPRPCRRPCGTRRPWSRAGWSGTSRSASRRPQSRTCRAACAGRASARRRRCCPARTPPAYRRCRCSARRCRRLSDRCRARTGTRSACCHPTARASACSLRRSAGVFSSRSYTSTWNRFSSVTITSLRCGSTPIAAKAGYLSWILRSGIAGDDRRFGAERRARRAVAAQPRPMRAPRAERRPE